MIRFNCPNCGRHYELPPALAFLPLLCKQCGQRITPPAPDAHAKPQAAPELGPAPIPIPAQAPAPLAPEAAPKLLPLIIDIVVFALLVVAGMLIGELIVQKPTGQVLSDSGAAPKFPPVDLLLWGGPPLMFALIYLLLGSRKLTVGAWFHRRALK